MTDFGFVKTVDKCCSCVDLKTGSIIIAIIALVDHTDVYLSSYYPFCNNPSHLASLFQSLIHWLTFVTNIAMIISAIAFIYGIIKGVNKTAQWFMYAILLSLILRILYITVLVVLGIMYRGCTIMNYQLYNKIIGFLIWFYFLSVIKSYKQEM